MDLSIIIINYNTLEFTQECISSIYAHTRDLSFEIIVVDNGSNNDSRDYFSKQDNIKYIYSEENLGFARANNLALNHAQGRNILFLNSDTLIIDNSLKVLSQYLDNHVNTGACGANLQDGKGAPNHSFLRSRPGLLNELNAFLGDIPFKLIFGKNLMYSNSKRAINVGYITGADLMVKSSVLSKVGPFDERFFFYYEDAELCYRIKKQGFSIKAISSANIVHLGGASTPSKMRAEKDLESFILYLKLTTSNFKSKLSLLIRKKTMFRKVKKYPNNPFYVTQKSILEGMKISDI